VVLLALYAPTRHWSRLGWLFLSSFRLRDRELCFIVEAQTEQSKA